MKTVGEALISEVHWPLPDGFVETVCIKRNLDIEEEFSYDLSRSVEYKGALADCLFSLVQAINFNEADKSFGNLTDYQRKIILRCANALYAEIGEEEKDTAEPTVYFMS